MLRRSLLSALVVVAFITRLTARALDGEANYLHSGYTLYLSIARTFVRGDGLCMSALGGCARRMPLYPLLIAPFAATGHLFPWLPAVQASFGAATVWVAWKITLEFSDQRAALASAALTAFNPYAVIHDTAMQETALFNLLVAGAVYLLLVLRRGETAAAAIGAGCTLGLAMLTTGRIELFLPCAVAWVALSTPPSRRRRELVALVAIPILLCSGVWAVRNWIVIGAPVLSTEVGKNLWVGNNEWTFSHFPEGSIDASQADSFRALSPDRRAALAAVGGEVAQDRLEGTWAREHAAAHPLTVVWGAMRKVWSALSAQYTPARGRVFGVVYQMIFLAVHVLAGIGLWRIRRERSAVFLILLLLGSFVATTAVFWAHTSHKSYLDAILFACASVALAPRARANLPGLVDLASGR